MITASAMRRTLRKPTERKSVMPAAHEPVQSAAPVQTELEHAQSASLAEQVVALERWRSSVTYADVRDIEWVLPVKRTDGRVIRGVQILRRLFLARDRQFYWIDWDQHAARPLSNVEVLAIVSLTFLQLRWRQLRAKQRRIRHR